MPSGGPVLALKNDLFLIEKELAPYEELERQLSKAYGAQGVNLDLDNVGVLNECKAWTIDSAHTGIQASGRMVENDDLSRLDQLRRLRWKKSQLMQPVTESIALLTTIPRAPSLIKSTARELVVSCPLVHRVGRRLIPCLRCMA